jgi:ABC-2 type transport system ATP-binding protein
MLKVKQLFFEYPNRSVFAGWEHHFGAGVTWVKGMNGCGKTTLFKILSGAIKPAMGDITLQGISLASEPLKYQQQIYYCGSGPINLKQNIEGMELMPFMDVQLRNLSTGTQRKVWLAFALAAGTIATLMDEPYNALDSKSLEYLQSELARCSKDLSRLWLVISHENLGDEIVLSETLTISA